MVIVYCETCGKRVPDADVESGRATQVAENHWLCGGCSPAATVTAPVVEAPAPAAAQGSTTRQRRVLPQTSRRNSDAQAEAPERAEPWKLYAMAGGGALLMSVLLVVVFGVGRKKEPAPVVASSERDKMPVSPEGSAPSSPSPSSSEQPVPARKEPPAAAEPAKPAPAPLPGLSMLQPNPNDPNLKTSSSTAGTSPALTAAERARQAEKEMEDFRNGRATRLLEDAVAGFKQNPSDPWTYKAKLVEITRSYGSAPAAAEARKLLDALKTLPAQADRMEACAPESKGYVLVYDADLSRASSVMPYETDRHAEITAAFDRIAYFLELQPHSGEGQWIYVSMDAFTPDMRKIAIPTFASGARFQLKVANLNVFSNVKGVTVGTGLSGNIEFWPNNYGSKNAQNIPEASNDKFDFGDEMSSSGDYGSMQVHNYEAKQTLFAFNRWSGGGEMGIGNQSGGNPDWTFSHNAGNYRSKRLRVLVRLKK